MTVASSPPPMLLTPGEQQRLQHAELLLQITKKMAACDGLAGLLESLVTLISWELRAERATLFLNDDESKELYSIVAQGSGTRQIRLLNNTGIAGQVFTTGIGMIVHDAYQNQFFNPEVDQQTGYTTESVLCVPIRTVKGEVIGVAQVLNKKEGPFTEEDFTLLAAMSEQAAMTLQSAQFIEKMERSRVQELAFLDMVADVTSEIDLSVLLRKVMGEATKMLQAERSTLFLNDEKSNELWSLVGEGIGAIQIRLPNHLGIAGTVFTSGESVNIPYAYADLRFNPAFDRKTGFFTRSILCVPVVNKNGKAIGVTQVLNKRGGPFTKEDSARLKAFTAQVSIALENAKLFSDMQNMKNYNESMLESMSNGVVTLNEEGRIVTCNSAGQRILQVAASEIIGRSANDFFAGGNSWIVEKIARVEERQQLEVAMDATMAVTNGSVSVNLSALPLMSHKQENLGTMLMLEDISSEKRVKSTMARYMDPGLADQLLTGGDDILGGKTVTATMLFSDIRGFTGLTEELGAQGTVKMLNEYFTLMVECIQREGGMLDKFIGDAIMAAFGVPIPHEDDEDRGVRAAIAMMRELQAWNEVRRHNGQKPVAMGIGINTDQVVSGNIGSPKRMDFTMIGDGVNLTARLESACKQYAAGILISSHTYRKLRGTYRIRSIDDVVVKGKSEPVEVYEVLDFYDEQSFPNPMAVVGHFNEGRQHYRHGQWEAAIRSFGESLRLHPGDKLSTTYIDRCRQLQADPPVDWRGIWVLGTK